MALCDSVSNAHRTGWARVFLLTLVPAVFAAGCGEPDSAGLIVQDPLQKYDKPVTLSGAVSDSKGPLMQGKIVATDEKGNTIASSALENSNRYSIVIPAGTVLPILLQAYPEAANATAQPLTVAVVEATMNTYNINPLTTAIADKAKSLGGYTRKNMMAAAVLNTSVPDEDKSSAGFRGDPTKNYGGWH